MTFGRRNGSTPPWLVVDSRVDCHIGSLVESSVAAVVVVDHN